MVVKSNNDATNWICFLLLSTSTSEEYVSFMAKLPSTLIQHMKLTPFLLRLLAVTTICFFLVLTLCHWLFLLPTTVCLCLVTCCAVNPPALPPYCRTGRHITLPVMSLELCYLQRSRSWKKYQNWLSVICSFWPCVFSVRKRIILSMITQEQLTQITPYFHHGFLSENWLGFGNTLLNSFAYQRYTWKPLSRSNASWLTPSLPRAHTQGQFGCD